MEDNIKARQEDFERTIKLVNEIYRPKPEDREEYDPPTNPAIDKVPTEYQAIKGLINAGELKKAPVVAKEEDKAALEVEAQMEALENARIERLKSLNDILFKGKIVEIGTKKELPLPPPPPPKPQERLNVNRPITKLISNKGRPRKTCICSNNLELCNKYLCRLED